MRALQNFVRRSFHHLQFATVRTGLQASSIIAPTLAKHWGMRLFAQPLGPRKIRYDFSKYPAFHAMRLCFQPSYRPQLQSLQAYAWGQPDTRPTVLLVHGWGGWGLQMGHFVQPLLDQGFAVIAVDMPAHGQSAGRMATLPLWSEAIQALLLQQPKIVGAICHSFGGGALAYALTKHPASTQTLQRIALMGAPADMGLSLQRFGQALGLSRPHVHAIQQGWEGKLGLSFQSMCVEASTLPKHISALLVHDEQDKVVGLDEFARYQRHWPSAQSLRTKNLGHQQVLRDPKVVAAVVNFMSFISAT